MSQASVTAFRQGLRRYVDHFCTEWHISYGELVGELHIFAAAITDEVNTLRNLPESEDGDETQ